MTVAMAVMMRVPTMAWYAPPPSPTTPRIEYVKNSASKRASPLLSTVTTTETRGISAMTKKLLTTAVTSRSVALRMPSTARDQA